MSLYKFYEIALQENPDLAITRQLSLNNYNDLKSYFREKVILA
jgi:hypothetical protein